jgi:hypothetical protein
MGYSESSQQEVSDEKQHREIKVNRIVETESIIISPKFLGELRKLPDDVLSFNASVTEVLY